MPWQRNGSTQDLTATVWRDMLSPLAHAPAKITHASHLQFTTFIDGIYQWEFTKDADSADVLFVSFHVNHDFKPGSTMYLGVHTAPSTAGQTGTVVWKYDYTVAKAHDQETFPVIQTITMTCNTSATQYRHQITSDTVGLTSSSLEPDTMIIGKFYRDGAAGSNAGSQFALSLDFHYQSDRYGTSQRVPPWDT